MSTADAAHLEHASMTEVARNSNIPDHVSSQALHRSHTEPTKRPTDMDAVAPKAQMNSFEYIWKSGVAGGLAGCAVSATFYCDETLHNILTIWIRARQSLRR